MVTRTLIQASANALPLAAESVQCVVTSPPYWGLRQYAGEQTVAWPDGSTHPLGLEPTPELYVAHMVEVFREVRRVLRADGTLWLNLGDSYAAAAPGARNAERWPKQSRNDHWAPRNPSRPRFGDIKPKDLVGIPWMVAFALRADGWYLRSDIIWAKPNPMPESVTDRPTKAHEYLFLLTKSERYFYDADAIKEPGVSKGTETLDASDRNADMRDEGQVLVGKESHATGTRTGVNLSRAYAGVDWSTAGRNKRTVWTIATRPYPGAHFATFPEQLVKPCILAGSSPQACGVCGAPWERVVDVKRGAPPKERGGKNYGANAQGTSETSALRKVGGADWYEYAGSTITTGWRPTCAHEDGTGTSTILDPFNGSGTTGRVAIRHGRSYVGVDLSREYLAEQATQRIDDIQHVMAGL